MLPAVEEDANPFESQRANDGVILFAFGQVVLHVIASPLAFGDREAGKLVESLQVKLGTGPPAINHSGFAAALGDRSDSAKALGILRGLITRAVRAKKG